MFSWQSLKKPILALAPMHEVTDSAFRQIIIQNGRPDVLFTWFVSVEGLNSKGRDRLLPDLYFNTSERPIIAQVFGVNPDNFYQAGRLIRELGFDGLDINMGCPDKTVLKNGSGAALIKDPARAKEIIQAAKEGSGLPVSIKTRLGVNENTIDSWLETLISAHPAAITLHGRTAKEMSNVPADWSEIARAGQMVKSASSDIVFLGNGDVQSVAEAKDKVKEFNLDGVMFGRAIFGNPWLFNSNISKSNLPRHIILKTLLEHTLLFECLHPHRSFALMKKHFSSYLSGLSDSKSLKTELMSTQTAADVSLLLSPHLKSIPS